jgi:hypothetical protein
MLPAPAPRINLTCGPSLRKEGGREWGRFLGSGKAHEVLEQGGLHAAGRLEAIRAYAASRAQGGSRLQEPSAVRSRNARRVRRSIGSTSR